MNGIIRKRVLALFSAVGLVGSTASAAALIAQGDKSPATKTESQTTDKQGKDAGKKKVTPDYTRHKKSKAADAGSKDAARMHQEAHIKGEKHAAETAASQNEANKKASQATPK